MAERIYAGNLPFEASERELEAKFAEYDEVLAIALPTDRETGRPRGFGLVAARA